MNYRTIYLPEAKLKAMTAETTCFPLKKHRWNDKAVNWEVQPSKRMDVVEVVEVVYNYLDRYLTRSYPHIMIFGLFYLFVHILLQLARQMLQHIGVRLRLINSTSTQ